MLRSIPRLVNAALPAGWQLVSSRQEVQAPPPPARFYAYLTPDAALTQLYDGHFIFVDPADEQLAPHLIARGYWELWIDRVVRRLARPGSKVIEVGANHGYYTLIMAGEIGAAGRLDSFEANPRLAGLVNRSVEFNGYAGRVTVHAKAAGDREGVMRFASSRQYSGGGHLLVENQAYPRESVAHEVPIVRLDDVITSGPVDLIRIDAEGAEPLILQGATAILARSPGIRICMEWHLVMMANYADVSVFIAECRHLGFRFWNIEHDSSLTELTDAALMTLELNDVVLARSDPFG
jgi:FkbM family methyltransferase